MANNNTSKALEFISYNRAGKIGISFAFRQLLEPSGYEGSQEIKSDDFVITNSGNYIIKVPYYQFLDIDFTYNDVLIYHGGSEVYRKPAIALQGTTGTLEYSVDPSVYKGGYEYIDISLTESILSKLQSLETDVEGAIKELDRSAKLDEENVFTERQEFASGIYTDGILMDSDSRIQGLGDGTDPQDAVNKSQLIRKQTGLPRTNREFWILDQEDRIVYGIDPQS